MTYTRSHKFCCCLPVRVGVIVMSVVSILLSGMLSLAAWMLVSKMLKRQIIVTDSQRIELALQTFVYTMFTATSLFGLIGCILRNRKLATAYSRGAWAILGLSFLSGLKLLFGLWRQDTNDALKECIKAVDNRTNASARLTSQICETTVKAVTSGVRVGLTVGLIIFWLIQAYGCLIVQSYTGQLQEEEDAKQTEQAPPMSMHINAGPPPTYYPFSANQHAYGQA